MDENVNSIMEYPNADQIKFNKNTAKSSNNDAKTIQTAIKVIVVDIKDQVM